MLSSFLYLMKTGVYKLLTYQRIIFCPGKTSLISITLLSLVRLRDLVSLVSHKLAVSILGFVSTKLSTFGLYERAKILPKIYLDDFNNKMDSIAQRNLTNPIDMFNALLNASATLQNNGNRFVCNVFDWSVTQKFLLF